ncbi:MAG: cupin domain-containing protein [Rhodospirillales bacterium]|tara:strand:+ start:44 stop:391 length:348 start_codon:yes stop_codon:yes gene_type:complete
MTKTTLPETQNLLAGLPDRLDEEAYAELAKGGACRLARIISTGQATPAGDWYDQPQDEWVLLVSGGARLLIEGEEAPRTLGPGDFLLIPARKRHRVEWTDEARPTVWLVLHFTAD